MKVIIFEADYEDIVDWLQSDSEDSYESSSESEEKCQPFISDTYVVECPTGTFNDIPYEIFEASAWHALTIKLDGMYITQIDIKTVTCITETRAVQVHPDKITVEYDSHWDCYCKTENVCGCGCDILHDGW